MVNWPEAVAYLQSCPPAKAKEQLLRLAMGKCRIKTPKPKIRLPRGAKPKVKKESVSKLKKELDRVFSLYIRQRGADHNGMTHCVTCGYPAHWKEMDAGHYVPRQDLATRWDPRNVWTQCKRCNGFRGGEPEKMAAHINLTIDDGAASALREQAKKPFKLSPWWLREQIAKYKALISDAECVGEGQRPEPSNPDSSPRNLPVSP